MTARRPHIALLICLLCAGAAGAQTETARTICSCEDPDQFTCARSPLHPEFRFSAFELQAFAGARVQGRSLRWHLRPAVGTQTTARLGFTEGVAGPLEAIALHVKNPNAHDLGLRLEVIDADGVCYLSPTAELLGEPGWRRFVFPLAEMRPANGSVDAWPGVDLPLNWLQVVIGPLEVGRPYTIYLDEFQAVARSLPQVQASPLTAPPTLGPSERIPVSTVLSAEEPVAGNSCLHFELQRDRATLARAETRVGPLSPGQTTTVRAENLMVPAWLPPGRYQVVLSSCDLQLRGPGIDPVAVTIGGPIVHVPTATIQLGGQRPVLRWENDTVPLDLLQVAGADVSIAAAAPRLVMIPATTDSHPFGWSQDVCAAEGVLDFTGLDRTAAGVLNALPDALLLLEVFLDSPRWWDQQNPDQLVSFAGKTIAPLGMWGRRRTFPDLVSGRWAGGVRDRLKALVEHVESSPYAHRVVGYELLAGDLGAWRPWGAELDLGDEDTPLRLAVWRSFLVDRYRNFAALRDAWGLPHVVSPGDPETASPGPQSWEGVVIPKRKPHLMYPALYDPASNGAWIDLNHFAAEMPARVAARLAALVDETVRGRKLVGLCYGHALGQSAGSWRWPHLALSDLLGHEALDFLTGPLLPLFDGPAFPTGSATNAGKLWLQRHPAREIQAGWAVLRPPASDPDVTNRGLAVIFDDVSARYLRRDGGLVWPLFGGQLQELSQLSVPWSIYTLTGLLAGQVPPARAYLFLDAFRVEAEQRNRLLSDLCRPRTLLVWVFAPGAIDTRMISGRTMKDLTGIKLSFTTTPGPLRVQIPANSPLLDELLLTGLSYGVDKCFPRFFSADDQADRMGMLAESKFVGLSILQQENCISVHSAAPGLPAEVLRGLLRRAGLEG